MFIENVHFFYQGICRSFTETGIHDSGYWRSTSGFICKVLSQQGKQKWHSGFFVGHILFCLSVDSYAVCQGIGICLELFLSLLLLWVLL